MNETSRNGWSPWLVGIVALGLVVAVAVIRSPEGGSSGGLVRERFWLDKVEQPPQFDMVLAGDSRILCDLSPTVMGRLTGLRTLNFGFNFVGYEPSYLDAIESKLDPAANTKVIVLGMTPRSLTPLNLRVSGFLEESSRPFSERMATRFLGGILSRLRPVVLGAVMTRLSGRTSEKNFYPDGLMSVELTPPDPDFDLKTYQTVFLGNPVSARAEQALLKRVSQWKSKGIQVFAFRPPAAPRIRAAEDEFSGFREQAFSESLAAAGGLWIVPDSSDIVLADGSHVAAHEVPRFSRAVAERIIQGLRDEREPGPASP